MYTADQLPPVASIADPHTRETTLRQSQPQVLHSCRAWFWTGSLWKEHKVEVLQHGILVRRAGFFWFEDMLVYAEGRTSRRNDFLSVSVAGKLLVMWFQDAETFRKFMASFVGLFHGRSRKRSAERPPLPSATPQLEQDGQ